MYKYTGARFLDFVSNTGRSGGRSEPKRGSRQELANHRQGTAAAAREASASVSELAELDGARDQPEEQDAKFLVLRLYEALNSGDARRAQELLAPDLEWWFHGPPAHQHMMRLLTGADHGESRFLFSPRSVDAFGSTVIAEGTDDTRQLYWVHAWTVGPDGVITQLREYFNTDLTVTRLSASAAKTTAAISSSNSNHASSSAPPPPASKPKCLWQSRRADRAHKSLPGLESCDTSQVSRDTYQVSRDTHPTLTPPTTAALAPLPP
uniref:Wound-induced protein 1 n=1 Tax=Oryza nivara TaxID=4536 RepID=A0A0E0GED5_ORYNI